MTGNRRCGANFAIGQLRMLVKIPPPGDDLLFQSRSRRVDLRAHPQ